MRQRRRHGYTQLKASVACGWLVLIATAATWPGGAQSLRAIPEHTVLEEQVLKVEEERDRAMQNRDMAVLNRIYADNVEIINTRGRLLTKAQRLADFQSGDLKFLSFDQGDYSFHFYGDTVILCGVARSVVQFHGRVNHIPRQFTLTYIKVNGHWQLVAQNETLIAQPR